MHIVAVGGSDAGISAALRAREVDPDAEVTVVAADAYPNFSICGIPYYVSGEVTHWRNLAHRTIADLEAAGMWLRLDTTARRIDVPGRKLMVTSADGEAPSCAARAGARPVRWSWGTMMSAASVGVMAGYSALMTTTARAPPRICAPMKLGTDDGAMPAKVSPIECSRCTPSSGPSASGPATPVIGGRTGTAPVPMTSLS